MRLLAWNIMHGGGPVRICRIGLALLEWAPEVIMLTEFRGCRGGSLRGVLADHGWIHQAVSDSAADENAVLIASRVEIGRVDLHTGLPRQFRRRLLSATLEDGTRLTAAHIPDAARWDSRAMVAKTAVWHEVLRAAACSRDGAHVVMGDLNTGRHRLDEDGESFSCTALMGRLASMGYADAWRMVHGSQRESSWTSHAGAGFRLDHAFVSGPLAGRVRGAEYGAGALQDRLSDHAPLLLEVV